MARGVYERTAKMCAKMSAAHISIPVSDETRAKISAALTGRVIGEGTRSKMRGRANHLLHGHTALRGCSPTYSSWLGMRQRCGNPKATGFKYWGGRGITVCERWNSFTNFLSDMGERPEGTSIDRIDNEGNYEPGNCRWSTPREQRQNRREK